ncbi:hypothetical protein MNBD_GAMMA20-146 [hydrothermal vent metagenome]|uniref:Uncharacterized protein n=1 Tax=hydrothermal vent metagenome TaxID=652676 RepID=A0A3B1ARI6_9ZZZZ
MRCWRGRPGIEKFATEDTKIHRESPLNIKATSSFRRRPASRNGGFEYWIPGLRYASPGMTDNVYFSVPLRVLCDEHKSMTNITDNFAQ